MTKSQNKFYIVLAPNGKEGIITDDIDDANYAQTGIQSSNTVSTIIEAFRDTYGDAEEDDFVIHEITRP